jgi:hypothetical protein
MWSAVRSRPAAQYVGCSCGVESPGGVLAAQCFGSGSKQAWKPGHLHILPPQRSQKAPKPLILLDLGQQGST